MAKIDTVIFDKTGTLTYGEPQLVDIIPFKKYNAQELLLFAATAEKFSEHPIGKAIIRAAEKKGLIIPDPDSFESVSGIGIKVKAHGRNIFVGRLKETAGVNVSVSCEDEQKIKKESESGRNTIIIGIEEESEC